MKNNYENNLLAFNANSTYKDVKEILYDLDRVKLLKKTIDELLEMKNALEQIERKDNIKINKDIVRIANRMDFSKNINLQKKVKELQQKLKIKAEIFNKKEKMLDYQLMEFRKTYYNILNKKINMNCGNLINGLETKLGKKIYCNLYFDIKPFKYLRLKKVLKKLQNEQLKLVFTISDEKQNGDLKQNSNVLYSKSFNVSIDDLEYDNLLLKDNLLLNIFVDENGKKYAKLAVDDIYSINLDFKLIDIIKEKKQWKPVDLLREVIINYKIQEQEYNKIKKKRK